VFFFVDYETTTYQLFGFTSHDHKLTNFWN